MRHILTPIIYSITFIFGIILFLTWNDHQQYLREQKAIAREQEAMARQQQQIKEQKAKMIYCFDLAYRDYQNNWAKACKRQAKTLNAQCMAGSFQLALASQMLGVQNDLSSMFKNCDRSYGKNYPSNCDLPPVIAKNFKQDLKDSTEICKNLI